MDRQYSIHTGTKNSFQILDYIIFAATLLVSSAIGIYYAVKDRKKENIKDFLLAGGNMHVIPVALSLLASFMSAITLLGTPAEIYNYTTIYLWIALGYVLTMACAAHVYIPIFYNLKLTSCYEYLELRFNRCVRTVGTLVFIAQMTIYMGIVLYGPSLAINAVTGFSLWGAICAVGFVCIFYTTLGGMKAVLWTDTFQVVMMGVGLLAALIQGCIEIGGFSKAWKIAGENHRVEYTNFDASPTTRHSIWSLVLGGAFLWTSVYGTNQAQVQRALTCSSLKDAQIALWLNAPGLIIILMLSSLIGVVMYAFYSTCDPIKFGLVFASDQLFPLFVMDILGDIPGIPGLFIACIFSGSLSSISSGLNSLAAVLLQDILKPYCLKGISEKRATLYSKIIAFLFGLICLGLTWVASQLGGILQAALSLFGMLGAPMLGLFTLGILFPWANSKGALVGLLTSISMMFWIGVGKFLAKLPSNKSPIRVDGCNWTLVDAAEMPYNISYINSTFILEDTSPTALREEGVLDGLYSISYLWYSTIAVIIVVTVGLVVSFLTGKQVPSELDPRLICPIFDLICPCLPPSVSHFLQFGVKHNQITEESPEGIVINSRTIGKATHVDENNGIITTKVVYNTESIPLREDGYNDRCDREDGFKNKL